MGFQQADADGGHHLVTVAYTDRTAYGFRFSWGVANLTTQITCTAPEVSIHSFTASLMELPSVDFTYPTGVPVSKEDT